MPASKFPIITVTPVPTAELCLVSGTDLVRVARSLALVGRLLASVVDQKQPAGARGDLLHHARLHLAGLAAFTQPWIDISD